MQRNLLSPNFYPKEFSLREQIIQQCLATYATVICFMTTYLLLHTNLGTGYTVQLSGFGFYFAGIIRQMGLFDVAVMINMT